MSPKHWLMKAEPDSRIVKGKDVKFSVDDFESVKTTPWEGVRNAEARNLMKEMKLGDKVLFYHSNCKVPGIAAFAEVSMEAYPDYTAWDPSHPYHDQKTDKENPKWYMVDVTFISRATHFVPLALLRNISLASEDDVPEEVAYIGEDGVKAIKQMALVTRGRLSVQRVEEKTWDVILQLAEKGGWDAKTVASSKAKAKAKPAAAAKKARKPRVSARKSKKARDEDEDEDEDAEDAPSEEDEEDQTATKNDAKRRGQKRKAEDDHEETAGSSNPRRSTRARK
ncbi:DUF55-domain-containing protein [Rhodofomes roseus]|uniref:DUF55-domain-containing protein n=1 Tax=Rhodofomes roseus TaxID=34475 RepID=A0ABQ8K8Z3_9APHY|nr:DUF55-domain-containing protein [Rhodofomes roseus]KAH9833791.1 DUF55-domain-containing protein [Rhodofomes roseus]